MSELTSPIEINIPGLGTIESADLYLKQEVDEILNQKDKEIAELKAALESEKNARYADSVDAGMRERRLKRALWLLRANCARMEWCELYCETKRDPGNTKWLKNRMEKYEKIKQYWLTKCRAMAEEYK